MFQEEALLKNKTFPVRNSSAVEFEQQSCLSVSSGLIMNRLNAFEHVAETICISRRKFFNFLFSIKSSKQFPKFKINVNSVIT